MNQIFSFLNTEVPKPKSKPKTKKDTKMYTFAQINGEEIRFRKNPPRDPDTGCIIQTKEEKKRRKSQSKRFKKAHSLYQKEGGKYPVTKRFSEILKNIKA